jgi:NAD(P)-dependent dehydrogenase (short-subunit alcohol dehydrogenase family)
MKSTKGSILVTGSNGGLGASIVEQILSQKVLGENYHGLYTIRKEGNDGNVQGVLRNSGSTHSHELVPMDLSSLSSVREAARKINARVQNGSLPPIRALILNAGYVEHDPQTFTDDGFDMTFQAGYLGHFLLTLLLLQSMDKENGRIVVVGSWTHEYAVLFSFFRPCWIL